ncbi:LuxR C-terminal-related transcriptional regulator [Streptomyces sp. NPDC093982]|uniref:ATP-binding protein n=1 Tax=Streptomyces sp. NPDC093982 TaxID=3155077 RepID=UPI003416D50C
MASTKRTCETCGGPVSAPRRDGERGAGKGGRPAKYCSNACRQRAFRNRATADLEAQPPDVHATVPGGTREAANERLGPPPGGALPLPLDRFIGRAAELARLRRLLRSTRLLTLVGPGGVGKSRLALHLSGGQSTGRRELTRRVALDPLRRPALLQQFVATALGFGDQHGPVEEEALVRALSVPGLLLVLDNCEHLAESCAELVALLLTRCPRLRILATSREGLRVPGEVVFRVGELSLPPAPGENSAQDRSRICVDDVIGSDAVRLFVERARTAAPGFGLTADTVDEVTRICHRLDGLPLAIELAARRVANLPLGQILDGLDNQLALLTDGSRIGPAHHRELRAAIAWSHRLLDPAEQAVLRRVSILAGGFGLDGALAVCAGDGVSAEDVLRLLCSLEEKSLLVRVPGGERSARFRQLRAIRTYGLGRLASSGELALVRERALCWLAGLTDDTVDSPPAGLVTRELVAERENLAAAVACTEDEGGDRHMRLAVALARVHRELDELTAARRMLDSALRRVPSAPHRSDALALAARIAYKQGDRADTLRLAEEAVTAARGHDRPAALADAFDALCVALLARRGFAAAVVAQRACLDITRRLGNDLATAVSQHRLAWALQHVGAVAEARALLAQCLPVLRTEAASHHHSAAVHTAGVLALAVGDDEAAEEAFVEGLRIVPPDTFHAMYPVEGLAIVAAGRGEPRRALRLAAAAAQVRARIGVRPDAEWQRRVDAAVVRARSGLDAEAAQSAQAAGQDLSGGRLVAYALRSARALSGPRGRGADAGPLTEREIQVAALVAEGLTNAQVAVRLGLSPRTVEAHLDRIRDKLGVRSRTRIAVWLADRAAAGTRQEPDERRERGRGQG